MLAPTHLAILEIKGWFISGNAYCEIVASRVQVILRHEVSSLLANPKNIAGRCGTGPLPGVRAEVRV